MTRTEAYAVLGIDPAALTTRADLSSRYRSLSMEVHPDRGGGGEEQGRVSEAYRIVKWFHGDDGKCTLCGGTGKQVRRGPLGRVLPMVCDCRKG